MTPLLFYTEDFDQVFFVTLKTERVNPSERDLLRSRYNTPVSSSGYPDFGGWVSAPSPIRTFVYEVGVSSEVY